MPALAITMSMPPNFSMPLSTAECIADSSRTSATTVSTRSSPSLVATSLSWASSRSASTSFAPLACRRRATSAPMPFAPPVISATFPLTELIAVNVPRTTRRRAGLAVLQLDAEQRVGGGGYYAGGFGVVAAVLQCVACPTIQRGNRFRGVKIVGLILAHPGQDVGRVGCRGQRRRGLPPLQP